MNSSLSSTKILGTNITNVSKSEILEFVEKNLDKKDIKIPIVTPNPEILMYAVDHKEYQKVLNSAKVSLADGVGVVVSGKILRKGIKERIAGVDFMLSLCSLAAERGFSVGFLGGREGVAEKTAECLVKKYPNLIVGFVNSEWNEYGFDKAKKYQVLSSKYYANKKEDNLNESKILNAKYVIHDTSVDILFVAFGFPKQEIWIDENLDKIPVTVAMGVGGAFDYISGNVRRAPKFVRDAGMEWAFRLAVQPWRIKRQLALPRFAIEVLKESFRNK